MFIVNPYIYSSASYLVDDYSAPVAYSVRKISSTATNCLRVRRSSDNAEQDIGFSGNDLDTASLSSFVGSNSAYVVKLYNQGTGGTTYDAINVNALEQPTIVNSGTIVTNSNGRTCISFNAASGQFLSMITDARPGLTFNQQYSFTYVHERVSTTDNNPLFGTNSNVNGIFLWYQDGRKFFMSGTEHETDNTSTGEFIQFGYRNVSDDNYLYTNSVVASGSPLNDATTGVTYYVGKSGARYHEGLFMELISWDSDESANRTDIESDINTYYSIY